MSEYLKAQQLPHCPWSLTACMHLLVRKSTCNENFGKWNKSARKGIKYQNYGSWQSSHLSEFNESSTGDVRFLATFVGILLGIVLYRFLEINYLVFKSPFDYEFQLKFVIEIPNERICCGSVCKFGLGRCCAPGFSDGMRQNWIARGDQCAKLRVFATFF